MIGNWGKSRARVPPLWLMASPPNQSDVGHLESHSCWCCVFIVRERKRQTK